MSRVIALLSDFGIADYYVAAMKAVILGIYPEATLVDISHQISKWNIEQGAFVLSQSVDWFPPDTVFVAVVDPGVGTDRETLAIKTRDFYFVGPDNGVLIPAARHAEIERAVFVKNTRFTLKRTGTFDGRDVMAPAAAHLARGVPLLDLGPQTENWVEMSFEGPEFEGKLVKGKIIHRDDFGNLVTNIRSSDLSEWRSTQTNFTLIAAEERIPIPYSRSYEEAPDRVFLIDGSSGYTEISLKQDSAADLLKLKVGDRFGIETGDASH